MQYFANGKRRDKLQFTLCFFFRSTNFVLFLYRIIATSAGATVPLFSPQTNIPVDTQTMLPLVPASLAAANLPAVSATPQYSVSTAAAAAAAADDGTKKSRRSPARKDSTSAVKSGGVQKTRNSRNGLSSSSSSNTTSAAKNMKARISDDEDDEEEEDETIEQQRRRRFLERNRVAASKCRQKKKLWIQELERRSEEVAMQNRSLHIAVAQLKEEVLILKNQLMAHRNCGCTAVHQYLQAEANGNTNPAQPGASGDPNAVAAAASTAAITPSSLIFQPPPPPPLQAVSVVGGGGATATQPHPVMHQPHSLPPPPSNSGQIYNHQHTSSVDMSISPNPNPATDTATINSMDTAASSS